MMPTESDLSEIVAAVWESLLEDTIDPDAPPDPEGLAAGSQIGFDGAWQGALRIECSEAAARGVTAQMLMLPVSEVDDSLVGDVLGELTNIIGGNVKALLPPPSILGLPASLEEASGDAVAVASFRWQAEPFRIALNAAASAPIQPEPSCDPHQGENP